MDKSMVGQTCYIKKVGNNARYATDLICEAIITKVGRKYFEATRPGGWRPIKFHIEDHTEVSDYCANWKFYLAKQEIYEEEEFYSLLEEIRGVFRPYGKLNLTLEQLRKIKEAISQ